jgi:hypothetical protein
VTRRIVISDTRDFAQQVEWAKIGIEVKIPDQRTGRRIIQERKLVRVMPMCGMQIAQ